MINSAGFRTLDPGEQVQFKPALTERGWQAHSVTRGDPTSIAPTVPLVLKPNPFTPQDPVTDPRKFAGRGDTRINAVDCLFNNKNVLVTGARGIGKGSVAYQLVNLTQGDRTLLDRIGIDTRGFEFCHLTGDHRCIPGNTIQAVARGLLSSLIATRGERPKGVNSNTEFKLDVKLLSATHQETSTPLPFDELTLEFAIGTEELLREAPEGTTGICYLIDELDLLDPGIPMAPFLKAVIEKLRMDGVPNVSFILSGVTGSTTELIAQHLSAGRLSETTALQPMSDEELDAIIVNALNGTGVTTSPTAKQTIIELSAHFPAPVQLVGYHAYRLDSDDRLDESDVRAARDSTVQNIKRQEFQGRLERVGGGLTTNILRVLARSHPNGLRLDAIAKSLGEEPDRVAGSIGNLIRDGFVQRQAQVYAMAEPLFRIYLRWVFGET